MVERHGAGQLHHRAFAGGVGHRIFRADETPIGGDVDDGAAAALALHLPHRSACMAKHGRGVCGHHAVPVVITAGQRITLDQYAGIVDETVEATEVCNCGFDRGFAATNRR